MLDAVMPDRRPHFSPGLFLTGLAMLSACAAGPQPVTEYLDELTAVTITHSRTPFTLSMESSLDSPGDFVQVGAIEVNRMGTHEYFLWLGISAVDYAENSDGRPEGFESIVFVLDDGEIQLDIHGWSAAAIGASKPVYKRLFKESVDAYYPVALEQLRSLTDADVIELRTTDAKPRTFVSWYRSVAAKDDLTEFLRIVAQ